jgi:hypothetical protein
LSDVKMEDEEEPPSTKYIDEVPDEAVACGRGQ